MKEKNQVQFYDTLVVGAGLLGSSVAMGLTELGESNVGLVDLDFEGTWSSSELNAGGVRATLGLEINIQVSRASIDYFSRHASEIGYRDCGYLWLHPEETWKTAQETVLRFSDPDWPTHFLSPQEIQNKFPVLNKLGGVAGGVFAPRDGLLNSNLLKLHFRENAKKGGAKFVDGFWVDSVEYLADGVLVRGRKFENLDPEGKKRILLGDQEGGVPLNLKCKKLVNCGGAWASRLAKFLGYSSPSRPVRRQISLFDCREVDLTSYGMTVDTSGVYFHPEATFGLSGYATPGESEGFNFEYDGAAFFEEHIWPKLYERSTHFERLRHVTGWAGLYEVSPDETGIVGRVEQGVAGNSGRIFEAHSFSGHGAMHSYAAGRGLAELVVLGRYRSLDLTLLSAERFEKGKLLHERLVI